MNSQGRQPNSATGTLAPGAIEQAAWDMIGRVVVLHPIHAGYSDYLCDLAMRGSLAWQWGGRARSPQHFLESLWSNALEAYVSVDKVTGQPLGVARAYAANHYHGHCSIEIYLADGVVAPAGSAFESVWMLIDRLFSGYGFRKVYGDLTEGSFEALASGISSYFDVEARLKRHTRIGSRFEDKIIIAMSQDQWQSLLALAPTTRYRLQRPTT